jgi:hypothetical protein
MEMTAARIDAVVASAFNNLAAANPAMRATYSSGMRPMDAATLSKEQKADLLQRWGGEADGLYTPADVQSAIAAL